jgi:hypothetical protein
LPGATTRYKQLRPPPDEGNEYGVHTVDAMAASGPFWRSFPRSDAHQERGSSERTARRFPLHEVVRRPCVHLVRLEVLVVERLLERREGSTLIEPRPRVGALDRCSARFRRSSACAIFLHHGPVAQTDRAEVSYSTANQKRLKPCASRKSFGTLANDQPRSKMSERGVHCRADAGRHERTGWAIDGVAKG